MKYGAGKCRQSFNGLNNLLQAEWRQRYKELSEKKSKHLMKNGKWAGHEDERIMYIPESLWEVAEKVGADGKLSQKFRIIEAVDN